MITSVIYPTLTDPFMSRSFSHRPCAQQTRTSVQVSGGAIHDDGASQNGAVVSTAFTVLSGNAFSQNTAPRGGAVSSNVAQTSFCNAQLFVNNVAPTGSNLFATGSEDSGDTKFCPTAPSDSTSGAFAADVGGVFASGEGI